MKSSTMSQVRPAISQEQATARKPPFDQAALKLLYETMQPLRTDRKPFDQKVKHETATTWLPKLVSEVKFTEWTSEGEMRHPAFLALRIDKKALDVIREQA